MTDIILKKRHYHPSLQPCCAKIGKRNLFPSRIFPFILDIYLNISHGLSERGILAQNERSEPEVCWNPQSTHSIHLTASQTHAGLFLRIPPRQPLLKESYCISGTDSKAQYSILILLCPLMQHSELEHLRTADLGHKVVPSVEGEGVP